MIGIYDGTNEELNRLINIRPESEEKGIASQNYIAYRDAFLHTDSSIQFRVAMFYTVVGKLIELLQKIAEKDLSWRNIHLEDIIEDLTLFQKFRTDNIEHFNQFTDIPATDEDSRAKKLGWVAEEKAFTSMLSYMVATHEQIKKDQRFCPAWCYK